MNFRADAVSVVYTTVDDTLEAARVGADLVKAMGVPSLGIDARVRVYLCRDEASTLDCAFREHSMIVVGGRRSWLPTRAERRRHALEGAGHFVVFVDPSNTRSSPMLDLFYVAIGVIGFIALWGITKACDRA
jgi:hypothetical protein